ncbi:MAG: hypothetical protein OXB86_02390 [Bdellovibrionales bacterium]|nr:hypothetical protein [Bdellovibrionales bacterium]
MSPLFSKSWIVFLLFFPSVVWAAGDGNPFIGVFFQAFNFILFVVLLVFFVRKPLQSYYKTRRENFLQFENMAREKEKKIQAEYEEWKEKLEKMEARDQTVSERAHQEGEKFRAKKTQELQDLKERKQREAEFFLRLESEKLKTEMLKKFKSDIVTGAAEDLKTLGEASLFHKKLQENFLKTLERRA